MQDYSQLERFGVHYCHPTPNGKVERAFNPQVSNRIQQARIILSDPRFSGPDEQFGRALHHLNKRPKPYTEDCVVDAVGALEGVAKIISGLDSMNLGRIMDHEPFQANIHATMRAAIKKIYAYRGADAAHGKIEASSIETEDAEWVLGLCAVTIVYFANKFAK